MHQNLNINSKMKILKYAKHSNITTDKFRKKMKTITMMKNRIQHQVDFDILRFHKSKNYISDTSDSKSDVEPYELKLDETKSSKTKPNETQTVQCNCSNLYCSHSSCSCPNLFDCKDRCECLKDLNCQDTFEECLRIIPKRYTL